MILQVQHVVPSRIVPQRGARPRFHCGRGTTSVELKEAARDEFTEVAVIDNQGERRHAILVRDGGLWTFPADRAGDAFDAARIAAHLESTDYFTDDQGDLDLHLSPGPFSCIGAWRGDPHALPPRTKVVTDHGERTSRAVEAIVGRDMAIVDGKLAVRLKGPLVTNNGNFDLGSFPKLRVFQPSYPCRWWVCAPVDEHLRAYEEIAMRHFRKGRSNSVNSARMEVAALGRDFPGHLVGDADLVVFANVAPLAALSANPTALLRLLRSDNADFLDRFERLSQWDALGRVGLITSEESSLAIQDAYDFLSFAMPLDDGMARHPGLAYMLEHARDFALPRIAARSSLEPCDLDALEGLGGPPAF